MPPTRGTKTFFKHLLQSGVVVHGGIRKTNSVETVVLGVDDDESASPALGNHGQSLRSENKLQDTEQLCEFPVGRSPNVTVTFHDYKTLEHDFFLNDIIIDFYLTYLHENMLNKEDASKVYILPTMFYKRMVTQSFGKSPDSFEKSQTLCSGQKRHMRVKGWTKYVDLFSKDMIIIPICEDNHWYLVIVVKLGLIVNVPDSEARRLKGEPFFIVLDRFSNLVLASLLLNPYYQHSLSIWCVGIANG